MDFDSTLITAHAIKADISTGKTKEELDVKYADFKHSHERMYTSILTDPNAIKIIEFMAYVKRRMTSGEITKDRADVEMGQFMANLYLPTEEQLSQAGH